MTSSPMSFLSPFAASSNPFAEATAATEPAPLAEGTYEYALVQSAPTVPAEECEVAVASVEVMILWQTSVLHLAHMTPPRSFYVGEEERKTMPCDYLIPAEKLGSTRAPIVLVDRAGAIDLVLLRGATGTIELAGHPKMSVASALASSLVTPSVEAAGAFLLRLTPGSKADVAIGGFVFRVSLGNAGRAIAGRSLDTKSLPYQGGSLLAHLGLLAAMAIFMPPLGLDDGSTITSDQTYQLGQYLKAAAEKEEAAKPTEQLAEEKADGDEGGQGARAKLEGGSMGSTTSTLTGQKYGVAGTKENSDPHISKNAALQDAANFGMVGLLNVGTGGDPNAPTSPWGRDDSLGNDALSARGNMWGDTIGESGGAGGLDLTGIGEGGGGRFEGIGLGSIGTIGSGSGTGIGDGFGKGHGLSRGKGHTVRSPSVRIGTTVASGRLPPEIIQRVVRQNFGRFKGCYESGLRNNPSLGGRVSVRFIIGREGAVSGAQNGGSDLPDSGVVSCVVRAFYGLSFPAPESGIVTVTYPIMFSPGG